MERLQKYMARCGVASRRKCEEYILQGRVQINGQTVTQLGTLVSPSDKVKLDGKLLQAESKNIYIMLNKPEKVMSTSNDPEGRPTVTQLIDLPYRLYPVGRLDYNTSGLILLTNDGDAAYRLTHPKYEIEKEYLAVIKGEIDRRDILKLERGVQIEENITTAPAKVQIAGGTQHTVTLSITIHEGRNREVRKMIEAIDKELLSLMRIRIGRINLGKLPSGSYRELNSTELAYINSLK